MPRGNVGDLIAAIASNGRTGYVYARDLNGPTPANPTQALEWQNSPLVTIHLPVYEADGRTRIGEFDTQQRLASLLANGR